MTKKNITLSVHQLVDFLLRTGDIDNRVFNSTTMAEGTLIHNLYQAKQGPNYISEIALQETFQIGELTFVLQGRADGIIKNKDGSYTIDEIKSTVADLEEFKTNNLDWHLGQAKCYAFMFAKSNHLNNIGVKLTYIKQGHVKEKKFYDFNFSFEELERDIYELLTEYAQFYNIILRNNSKKLESIKRLEFPFDKFREGQRKLAKYAYSIARNGGKLFVEAPTGIGKTMSTLFPFIKGTFDNEESKIFYLTAKSSGKTNADNAIKILKSKGLEINNISITAKDKICLNDCKACNPDECPFARGYYNKIKDVLKDALLCYNTFDFETIIAIAKTYNVCPFELELDLSLFCDVIVCDYNYLFDPISYMKRYFDESSSNYLVLVDEAHNLVDRSRKMYSASISKDTFLQARKSLRKIPNKSIKSSMAKIKKLFSKYDELTDGTHEFLDIDYKDFKIFESFLTMYQNQSKNNNKDITEELKDLYLEINKFNKISELFCDHYLYYINKDKDDLTLNLLCLDASNFLKNRLNSLKGTVLFSATLSPIDYFMDLLGGDKRSDPHLSLKSPFSKENMKLMVAPKVSVKYKNRENSYKEIAEYINIFSHQKIGNYLIYFPSYEYLINIQKHLELDDLDVSIQNKDMSEIDRENFVSEFKTNPSKTHIGLAIMGGAFSEGIDLVSDRLSGILIVGIGLSRINYEDNKISEYYDKNGLDGYDYAYLFPGMNKVMQAIGRLIRSEDDRGNVLLIDERYVINEYRDIYKKQYPNYEVVLTPEEYKEILQKNS